MKGYRKELLARLWEEGRQFDAEHQDRFDRRRNLEPESAELLNILVRTLAPRAVLELGTSNGFSTIWIAEALESSGGTLLTVDNDPGRAAEATQNLVEAGLSGRVDQRVADAADVLAGQADESWGFVFLDAERSEYVNYWPEVDRILAPGGLLVVDNCISHAGEVAEFRALVDTCPDYRQTLVPIGAGLLLISKERYAA